MAGVRFFEMSFADINRDEATLSIDNNSAFVSYLNNRDPLFNWVSAGSNDADTITLEADFGRARTIDTLILNRSNLKGFTLQYLTGSNTWLDLCVETGNTSETFFRQFAPVSTTAVRLLMTTTMTPDAQKSLQDFIITREIGQLVGYPKLTYAPKLNTTKKKMINQKNKIVASGADISFRLSFQDHVGDNDRALFNTLATFLEPFLVWPSGGNADQFAYADNGYRLQDIFLMTQDTTGYSHTFTKNLYFSGFNADLNLIEAA